MSILKRIKDFFYGRPMTQYDRLVDRAKWCYRTGMHPDKISNFWEGLEDLREEFYKHNPDGWPHELPDGEAGWKPRP